MKVKSEFHNKKEQFGIHGFFVILLAYIFRIFILWTAEGMNFNYTLSSFANLGMKAAEIISNFIIVALIVKFSVKPELLSKGIFKKFIINFFVPVCILIFIEDFINEIFYEAAKYEFWIYFTITVSAVIKFLKGFIWISGIFIFTSEKTFILFDFFKKLKEKVSLLIAFPLIVFLNSIEPLIFNLVDLRSIVYNEIFGQIGSISRGLIYFLITFTSIYTVLGVFLFFINMLTKSSYEIENYKNNIFSVVTFIKDNMPFFILKIVFPQAVLIYLYYLFTNITYNTRGVSSIFMSAVPIFLFVFIEALVIKSIFSFNETKVSHTFWTVLFYGFIVRLGMGSLFKACFIKIFTKVSKTAESIFRSKFGFWEIKNIFYDSGIVSVYLVLILWFVVVYTIIMLCIIWCSKNKIMKLNLCFPFIFIRFLNPLKTSLMAFSGFIVFFSQYVLADNFYRITEISIFANPTFLLILFSVVIIGSVFMFYIVQQFKSSVAEMCNNI